MKYAVSLVLIILLVGCAGVKETTDRAETEKKAGAYDESFDPMSLDDDDISISEEERKESPAPEAEQSTGETEAAVPGESRQVDGWRVQILATKNIENATLIHQEAGDQFKLSDINAYLIFEAPLYKVRIGNALTRNEAETIRDLARDYGYTEAFIVRSKVMVNSVAEPDLK